MLIWFNFFAFIYVYNHICLHWLLEMWQHVFVCEEIVWAEQELWFGHVCVCVCLHAHTHIPGHSWVIPSTETEKGPFDSSPFLWSVEWGLWKDLILLILISRHTQTDGTFAMVIHQWLLAIPVHEDHYCMCLRLWACIPYPTLHMKGRKL